MACPGRKVRALLEVDVMNENDTLENEISEEERSKKNIWTAILLGAFVLFTMLSPFFYLKDVAFGQ